MSDDTRRIENFYFVNVIDPISKKWRQTNWRMTEADVKSRYAEGTAEILWDTKEERTVGGDPDRICTSSFLKKVPSGDNNI
jgi:hypothetical protein